MFCDCHMHMILDGVDWRAAIARHQKGPDEEFLRRCLKAYQDRGFTYLRAGGDRWGVGKRARELAPEYGITYRSPLANLCKRGHYGSFIGETYADFKDFAALVRKARTDGADFIKIMISGLMDFDHFGRLTEEGYPPEEIRVRTYIAHEEGFAVMAHANGARTVDAAAAAGIDSIEHGAYQDEASLAAMKENGCVWVPTLSTVGNLRGTGRFDEGAVREILAYNLGNAEKFAAMGGLIAPGTDAGAWAVPQGCLSEYELLSQIPRETLEAGIRVIQEKF